MRLYGTSMSSSSLWFSKFANRARLYPIRSSQGTSRSCAINADRDLRREAKQARQHPSCMKQQSFDQM